MNLRSLKILRDQCNGCVLTRALRKLLIGALKNNALVSLPLKSFLWREDGTILANALYKNETLTFLDLEINFTNFGSNFYGRDAGRMLVDYLHECSMLTTLDLSSNKFQIEGRKDSLTSLYLVNNGFYGEDGNTLAQALCTDFLTLWIFQTIGLVHLMLMDGNY
ncbi:hypothetical protein F8M41_015577 [Gigaspora margarita]|uniref:Uncharacterized protein n=1 Tax=Gigaspora margarita TaxID=4874 RepID=A0A8H4ENE2_GIGMA|nr:hypothetical protein F8M41_015577 [Gigaspora margarita]